MEKNYFSLYLKYKSKYLTLKNNLQNHDQTGGGKEKKKYIYLKLIGVLIVLIFYLHGNN